MDLWSFSIILFGSDFGPCTKSTPLKKGSGDFPRKSHHKVQWICIFCTETQTKTTKNSTRLAWNGLRPSPRPAWRFNQATDRPPRGAVGWQQWRARWASGRAGGRQVRADQGIYVQILPCTKYCHNKELTSKTFSGRPTIFWGVQFGTSKKKIVDVQFWFWTSKKLFGRPKKVLDVRKNSWTSNFWLCWIFERPKIVWAPDSFESFEGHPKHLLDIPKNYWRPKKSFERPNHCLDIQKVGILRKCNSASSTEEGCCQSLALATDSLSIIIITSIIVVEIE